MTSIDFFGVMQTVISIALALLTVLLTLATKIMCIPYMDGKCDPKFKVNLTTPNMCILLAMLLTALPFWTRDTRGAIDPNYPKPQARSR
jgi:hypothetical protein